MVIPVILSGGAGSRLWPVSREAYPKPFTRLADGRSLLRRTFERAARLDGIDRILTVTNREYYFLSRDEYLAAELVPLPTFLLEPSGRNTAPAVAMAALFVANEWGHDTQLLVMPADHLVEDEAAFARALKSASRMARDGALVTFGIRPTYPESGFGYMKQGAPIGTEGARVAEFVEKPSAERAPELLQLGIFFWNSGMFCFGASAFLGALQKHAPDLLERAKACWRASEKRIRDKIEIDPSSFASLPDISVDYAVMEKHEDVAMVKATFDWNDIGSWAALAELTRPDAQGNRVQGEAVLMGARDCYIQSDARIVAALGVNNVIVVDTPDALLIVEKSQVQQVKKLAQHLKLTHHTTHLMHHTTYRPWSTYTVLE